MTDQGVDEEDPYGGDWDEIGGWPEPALPPDEADPAQPAWPPHEDDPGQPAWPPQEPAPAQDPDGGAADGDEGYDAG
jgi:hypothetical protein